MMGFRISRASPVDRREEDRSKWSSASTCDEPHHVSGSAMTRITRSIDPLPFLRPEPFSTILTGRAAGLRVQRRGLPPGGSRRAKYEVGRRQLTGQEPYRIEVKLIAAMVPVNLISEIAIGGFDYGLSRQELAARVVKGHIEVWQQVLPVRLNGPSPAPLVLDHAKNE